MGEAYVPAKQPPASQEARFPAPDVNPSRASHSAVPEGEGTHTAVRLTGRIRDRRTFAALRHARRSRSGPLTVRWHPDGSRPPRIAYAIGRQVGSAVRRNRVRRQLRAAITRRAGELSPGAYLIGAGAGALGRSMTELDAHLGRALSGVSALAPSQQNLRHSINSDPGQRRECRSNHGVCV